jgi:hypothetical protein
MRLETATLKDVTDRSDEFIESTIRALPASREPFAILALSPETYIQTYWSQDGFELEYQEGTVERHYRVTRWVTQEETVDAFLRFARGDRSWITKATFERLDPATWEPCEMVMVRRVSPLLTILAIPFFVLWYACRRLKKRLRKRSGARVSMERGLRLGLDWDDTVTAYPAAFRLLSRGFRSVVIITLNHGLTLAEAESRLGRKIDRIEYCPDDAVIGGESHIWKARTCRRLGVDLMFDDDIEVVEACLKAGVHAIGVWPLLLGVGGIGDSGMQIADERGADAGGRLVPELTPENRPSIGLASWDAQRL